MKANTVGDLFCVDIAPQRRKFFQYVGNDATQLNSSVIRVFTAEYSGDEQVDLVDVAKGEIDFYAHCFLRNRIKSGFWCKVGNTPIFGSVDIIFRNTNDYGNPNIVVSRNWHIWKMNEPFKRVGNLDGRCRGAEIGVVVTPESLVHRMRTGRYDFKYPAFDGP